MKIHGIDPVVLDRIRERTNRKIIYETERSKITGDKHREDKEKREKRKPQQNLENVIGKLNEALEQEGVSLRFEMSAHDGRIAINLINTENNNIISTLTPDKIYELLKKLDSPSGIIVDESV